MPAWSRNLVIITGMLGWAAIIGASLWFKQIPGAVVLGFPAGLWLAVAGKNTITRGRAGTGASPTEHAEQEES
jgi:hypothetical protein